jgi:diguanylate cyclase (GGDEF)-like protein/PAS domain S-box-containing protein
MIALLDSIDPLILLLSGIVVGVLVWIVISKFIFKPTTNKKKKFEKTLSKNGLAEQHLAFAVSDRNGMLTYSNEAFLKLFGATKDSNQLSILPLLAKPDRSWWREEISQTGFVEAERVCNPELKNTAAASHIYLQVNQSEESTKRVVIANDFSSFYRINEHLRSIMEQTSQLSSVAPFGMLLENKGIVLQVNQAFCEMFGTEKKSMMGTRWLDTIPQLSSRIIHKALQQHTKDENFIMELELEGSNNRKFWCNLHINEVTESATGNHIRCWYFDDASAQKSSSKRLKQSAVVFEASSDAIMIVDNKRKVKMVNSAFCTMTGFDSSEIQGRSPQILGAERKDIQFLEKVWSLAEKKGEWQGEVWKRRKSGERYPEWLSITAVKNKEGDTEDLVAISSDMTTRKQAENRIRYQANYDPLTDLPNRNLFMDRLRQGINRAKREGTMLALLFIDLDRFKYINDSFGHAVGDKLLIKVASLLKDCVRSSDSIARFGGDEFAIILSPIYGSENASRVSTLILERLGQPIDLDGYEVVSEGSIGISLFPNDGATEELLVKNADTAMYRAKERGRNTYQFFTEEMQRSAQERVLMERDLRAAVKNDQLSLAFQPQMDCSNGTVGGLEVLMRWKNGNKGNISPAVFIALAEDTGMIVQMGTWILKKACEQFVKWKALGLSPNYLAVNVSTRQFRTKNFIDVVKQILNETGMLASELELELTESMLMEDREFARKLLLKLRGLGLKLSIDDFGTGYSSLSYLKKFPLNNLKVDQSFVKDLQNADNASIVKAIVDLGHTLDMQIIAEGVETEQQLNKLGEFGVDFIQGYYFSKPLTAELCEKFLKKKLESPDIKSYQSKTKQA